MFPHKGAWSSFAFLVFCLLLFLLSAFSHPHPPSAGIRPRFTDIRRVFTELVKFKKTLIAFRIEASFWKGAKTVKSWHNWHSKVKIKQPEQNKTFDRLPASPNPAPAPSSLKETWGQGEKTKMAPESYPRVQSLMNFIVISTFVLNFIDMA